MTIPDSIRRARLEKTMTMHELSSASGVSRTTISHYEREERPASVRSIKKLADALDVPPSDLVKVE